MSTPPDHPKIYDHDNFEFLNEVGRDLTLDAKNGLIKPVTGRDQEIQMIIETLCRRTKSNPILLGPAGVGKTAVVEGLALRIADGEVPKKLNGCRLFSVSTSSMIAGSNWYGMIESKIKNLLAEARNSKIIVFIDEIHTIVGTAPDADSSRDIAQQLKPALARGEIRLIGATTDEEFRRFIDIDQALERRFTPIAISEMSADHTLSILRDMTKSFSSKHGIEIGENILRMVMTFGTRFMRNRHFPDKAIDLFEQIVSFTELQDRKYVSVEDARKVMERTVGMPSNLDEAFHCLAALIEEKHIFNSEQAKQLTDYIQISMQGLNVSPNRPNANVFMLGGLADKAYELAEAISDTLFSAKNRIIKLNFADLSERWELNQMLGIDAVGRTLNPDAPIARISQTPWCIIICEGLHTASHVVQEAWSNIIENGYLRDSKKKRIHISDSIVIVSSDIDISPKHSLGFKGSNSFDQESDFSNLELQKNFSNSLIKFADFIFTLDLKNADNDRQIWLEEILFGNLGNRLKQQGIDVRWSESFIKEIELRLEPLNDKNDWERLINSQILPELSSLFEVTDRKQSFTVSFESQEIKVEAAEISENDKEIQKYEESQKSELYNMVLSWVKGQYFVKKESDFSMMTVSLAQISIDLYFSFWKEQLLISFLTPVAENVVSDEKTLRFLLEKNMGLRFGKFSIEDNGTIWLEYSTFGSHCNKPRFLSLIQTLAANAQKYTKILKKMESKTITSNWLSDDAANWLDSRRVKTRR